MLVPHITFPAGTEISEAAMTAAAHSVQVSCCDCCNQPSDKLYPFINEDGTGADLCLACFDMAEQLDGLDF